MNKEDEMRILLRGIHQLREEQYKAITMESYLDITSRLSSLQACLESLCWSLATERHQ